MKRLIWVFIFLFPWTLAAQDYAEKANVDRWKEVERLISIKNYEQIRPMLADIKATARNRGDRAEWVRAVLAESRVMKVNNTDDATFVKIRKHFQEALLQSDVLEKAVLQNFYGMFLWANANRYLSESTDDFVAADAHTKHKMIDSIFQLSLKDKRILITSLIKQWTPILEETHNPSLTPTIYHLLIYPYMDFLRQASNVKANDKIKALKNDLMVINKAYGYRDAISYLLSRDVVRSYRSKEFIQSYEDIVKEYLSDYNAFLLYQIALWYDNEENDKAKALEYIHRALAEYPDSPWISNIKGLEKRIKQVALSLEHQLFVPSREYNPIKLTAQNADTLYIRVYNTTNTPKNYKQYSVRYDSASFLTSVDASIQYEEQKVLKAFGDHKSHQTIYKLNPLPPGNYIVLVSNNKEFKNDGEQKTAASSTLMVTDVFISATMDKETKQSDLYKGLLIDRKTGRPYAQKKIQLYDIDSKVPRLLQSLRTNQKGEFVYKTNDRKSRHELDDYELFIPEENQFIALMELDDIPDHSEGENDKEEGDTQFQTMLDRAIYRPGQMVYFKTILYNDHELTGKVIDSKEIDVFLCDANRQKIDSLKLTTNAFGSIHGSFRLPNKILAGTFRLELVTKNKEQDVCYLRVEEYKRPTFKVEFEPNKETYTLKDTAVFIGKAESLAGAKLPDASVRYTVRFYSNIHYKTINYLDTVTTTDAEGKFRIVVPLTDTVFRDLTNFWLNFKAEVSNQSGEMQSASGSYAFAAKPWRIAIQSAYRIEEDRWSSLNVRTTNQNNQPLKFAGSIHVYKIIEQQKPLSDVYQSYFKNTEYHLLDNSEYEQYFPHYFDALTLKKDPKEYIKSYTFDTRDTSLVKLDSSLFGKGEYRIEAFSVHGNDTIQTSVTTHVYDAKTGKTKENQFFSYALDKDNYTIGDKVTIHFYTDVVDPQNIFLFPVTGHIKGEMQVLAWENRQAVYRFVLTKDMISPMTGFTALFIRNNQAAHATIGIPIVRTDKSLEIKTVTFRDKITPGQHEKWSFTINHKNQKTAIELLATMYDSSLDVFASNNFRSNFAMNRSYYNGLNYYYLRSGFNQKTYSHSLFSKSLSYRDRDNKLSIIRSYNLWNPEDRHYFRTNFGGENGMDEVVVTGLGGQRRKLSLVGAVSLEGQAAGIMVRGVSAADNVSPLYVVDGEIMENFDEGSIDKSLIDNIKILKDAAATALYGTKGANGVVMITTKEGKQKEEQLNSVQARTNLQETAFFYPTLYTDTEGNVSFEFDSPEALTKWKLLLFAHGKNLEASSETLFTQTQKQLMVRPNLPRYFREGDRMTIKAQIQNLSKTVQQGNARIEILNPESNEIITAHFIAENSTKPFETQAGNNTIVEWYLTVPENYPSVHIKIVAATDEFSDGEIQEIPILPNRILISDTEKIVLKVNEAKTYPIHAGEKDNLQARIQVQSNPILEIISALDYLKNYPYECSEQSTSKWFGLKMVEYIAKHYPAIADYFKSLDMTEAHGKLEENSSLNELKLEEMSWLRDIKDDEAKLKTIATLFKDDIQEEIRSIERKILKNQLPSGGFSWFEGGKENTYISTRILEILGKVLYLDKTLITSNIRGMAEKLTIYLDKDSTMFSPLAHYSAGLDYLYARQYWNVYFGVDTGKVQKLQHILAKTPETSANGPAGIAAKSWVISQIYGGAKTSAEIKNRLTQEAVLDEDKGLYWESNLNGYNSTSLQSYMVEAYKLHDPDKLHAITQWLYYNKQVNNWRTTWMTVDAVYALLLANNPQDFAMENSVKVYVDQIETQANKAVLGQFTKSFNKEELQSDKTVRVENNNSRTVYGNIVYQYFLPLEHVKNTTNAIFVYKQYFVLRNGIWIETKEAKLGEHIKVKLTVINDAALQYVHLKDARPSGVEPVYQPSGYKWWQGYYFSMKDASTNYFFDQLGKGKHEFEYEVKANNAGVFNSGITTVTCMYDPSVHARSENVVLTVRE